jgi:hypothetical protein
MKFDIVTQWVRINSDSSPTWPKVSHQDSSEVRGPTLRGESEAGWIKDAGCVLSPEKCIVVVIGIIPLVWEKADDLHAAEGSSPTYVMASMGDTTGV